MKISLADLIIQKMILFDKPAHYIQIYKKYYRNAISCFKKNDPNALFYGD